VLLVLEENTGYQEVIGNAQLPFVNSLAAQYGLASNWFDLSHPSLPNYLALTSGSIWDNPSDTTPQHGTYPGPSFVDQLAARGIGWKAYMEDMPRPCDLTDQFGPGHYDVNHNPFIYYTSIRRTKSQCGRVVPFGALATDLTSGRAPPLMWVSPNLVHDMHDGTAARADSWMRDLMRRVTSSRWWSEGGIVVLTWDESEPGDQIATIVVSARLHHAILTDRGDHYGTLRGLEEIYGVPLLGGAASPSHGDLRPLLAP
jgi:phosphatidylinositol-3-phosphatase